MTPNHDEHKIDKLTEETTAVIHSFNVFNLYANLLRISSELGILVFLLFSNLSSERQHFQDQTIMFLFKQNNLRTSNT